MQKYMASRESTINLILDTLRKEDLVIACNGKIGRELYELREKRGEPADDFILIGAMGRALGVAIGVAKNTNRKVICLLGDGNFLMGMGSLATYMKLFPRNLYVYILNNSAHDSTGGQPTSFDDIRRYLPKTYNFRVIDVELGSRPDLGRPKISPEEITVNFMKKCHVS
jgi:phosphonopyruvate decarboxylase